MLTNRGTERLAGALLLAAFALFLGHVVTKIVMGVSI